MCRLAKVACSAYQMAAEGLAVEGIDMDVNDQLAELQRRISLYAITLRDDKVGGCGPPRDSCAGHRASHG